MHTHTYLGAMPTTQRTNFHTTRAHRRFDLWRICIITKPHHVCNFPSYYRTKVISNINKVLRLKVRAENRKILWIPTSENCPEMNCSEVAPAFVGPPCAHGGSERPNRAALPVTKSFLETRSATLLLGLRHDADVQRSYVAYSAFGTGSEKNWR